MNSSPSMLADTTERRLWQARIAVASIFGANSAVLTAWIARIPDIKAQLGLSEGTLGLTLLSMALGALVAQPLVGWLLSRVPSHRMTALAGVCFCVSIVLLAISAQLWMLVLALFLFGALNGGLDVAMNAQAALVEQQFNRPIMSSFHGLWSVGALIGSALSGLAAARGLPLVPHFALAAALGLLIMLFARPWLWPDAVDPEAHAHGFALPPRALLTMGIIAFATLLCEGAVADWSAVYLRDMLSSGPGMAALGYAAFSLLMAGGRLTGDWIIARLGAHAVVRGGGALVVLGMVLVITGGNPVLAIGGFALVGAGVACIFPVLLSVAARTPGILPGTAIAGIATTGYTGFLVGPPLIGLLAELTDLRIALGTVMAAGVLIVVLSRAMRSRAAVG